MNSTNPTRGIIHETYSFALDGEYSSGHNEHKVTVIEWWKSGELKNKAKEVKVDENNTYFRHTKKNGWRKYNKSNKTFRPKIYTGTSLWFVKTS
tara:strand:+ start:76 stop:357 length:282 start_codon:yes stop_codon:yes gene_type:complete